MDVLDDAGLRQRACDADIRQRAWNAAAAVVDPEIPVLTIADLGVLRGVEVHDGCVEVSITPAASFARSFRE